MNLSTIAKQDVEDLYIDYCHLTAKNNRVVAEKFYPRIDTIIGLPALTGG